MQIGIQTTAALMHINSQFITHSPSSCLLVLSDIGPHTPLKWWLMCYGVCCKIKMRSISKMNDYLAFSLLRQSQSPPNSINLCEASVIGCIRSGLRLGSTRADRGRSKYCTVYMKTNLLALLLLLPYLRKIVQP